MSDTIRRTRPLTASSKGGWQFVAQQFSHRCSHPCEIEVQLHAFRLGDIVDFSGKGDGRLYAAEGWSGPEDWGRWSLGEEARILMRISGYIGQELTLNLTYVALANQQKPCQKVAITGNGYAIATQDICLADAGGAPAPQRYRLPVGLVSADGLLEIRIKTPDAISPKHLGINEDSRILGVGLKTLQIVE